MLRKVATYKTIKQWENSYKELRKEENVDRIREEIRVMNKGEAIQALAQVDGLISLYILIVQIREIKHINEQCIADLFERVTGKNIKSVNVSDAIHSMIKKDDLIKFFQELIDKRTVELTEGYVNSRLQSAIHSIFEREIKPHVPTPQSEAEKEIQSRHIESLMGLFLNEIFLISSLELFLEIDKRQVATSTIELVWLMKSYVAKKYPNEALSNPFIIIQHWAKLVHPGDATHALWSEMALWLDGMHARTFYQIPEKYRPDGVVKKLADDTFPLTEGFGKEKDIKFKKNFKLTFYNMALLYSEISQSLQNVLKSQLAIKPEVISELEKAGPPPAVMDDIVIAPPSIMPETLSSSVKGKEAAHEIPKVEHAFEQHEPGMIASKKELTTAILERIKDREDNVLFTMLLSYLNQYNFSERMVEDLNNNTGDIIATLKGYTASHLTTHYLPTFIWERPHTRAVNETIDAVNMATHPKEQIKELINLYRMAKGAGSIDLMPKVAQLIKDAYVIIEIGLMEEDTRLQAGPSTRTMSLG